MKTTFRYDHYYKYEELKSNLEFFAETYPKLAQLEVNCVTPEGRNQYVMTLTNTETGDALSKPGWYLDGNIHAGEVTASMCAMHTIDYLLTNYETDHECHLLLDHMTIYVIPRVTPDGAETYLSTPYNLRSANRDYMPVEGGIRPEDLDGDGVIRMMRIPTPYGAWKKDPDDCDAMVMRSPSDICGEFYDIYPEGILEEYDGSENLKQKKPSWGLDFNRNFPLGWFPDSRQPGAGAYPLCNVETKAVVDFALSHPNIGGAAIGHTSGGIILYPPGTRPAKSAPSFDIEAFKAIADMGQQELGYTPMNIFDSFMRDQEHWDSGALDDWFYQSQGVPAYTMEFWDVYSKAGFPMKWGEEAETKQQQLARFNGIMNWVKQNAPQYFCSWKEYDHLVFGKVEIGGFNTKFTIQNPPENLLIHEVEHDTKFNLRFAQAMPHLHMESITGEKVTDGVYRITAVIGNRGYLPVYLSEEALSLKTAKPVLASISGCEVINGKADVEAGMLSGYSRTVTGSIYGNLTTMSNAPAKKKLEWIVKANAGDVITVTATHEKAGSASITVTVE